MVLDCRKWHACFWASENPFFEFEKDVLSFPTHNAFHGATYLISKYYSTAQQPLVALDYSVPITHPSWLLYVYSCREQPSSAKALLLGWDSNQLNE